MNAFHVESQSTSDILKKHQKSKKYVTIWPATWVGSHFLRLTLRFRILSNCLKVNLCFIVT